MSEVSTVLAALFVHAKAAVPFLTTHDGELSWDDIENYPFCMAYGVVGSTVVLEEFRQEERTRAAIFEFVAKDKTEEEMRTIHDTFLTKIDADRSLDLLVKWCHIADFVPTEPPDSDTDSTDRRGILLTVVWEQWV